MSKHYVRVRAAVQVLDGEGYSPLRRTHLVIVLVGTVHRGVIEAVRYAKSLAPERLIAVSVVTDHDEQERLTKAWTEFGMPIELHTIASPYRELTQPVLAYLDELDAEDPDDVITVVIPEFVTQWKTQWLHNQSAFALKARLLYRPNTVVTSVPVIIDAAEPDVMMRWTRRRRATMAAMQFWKPHALAKPHEGQLDLRTGDRVKATVDLPGIAEGTEGKVMLANGFNWQRYRVRFHDGTELGDLDHRHLAPIGARRQAPGEGGGQGPLRSIDSSLRPGSGAAW